MVKVVNGVVIADVTSTDGTSTDSSSESINFCGFMIPKYGVGIFLILSFFVGGLKGAFAGSILLALGYILGNNGKPSAQVMKFILAL